MGEGRRLTRRAARKRVGLRTLVQRSIQSQRVNQFPSPVGRERARVRVGWMQQPALVVQESAVSPVQPLPFPELARAGLAELVKSSDPNQDLRFLRQGPHPPMKIRERGELTLSMFSQQPVDGPLRESLGPGQRHANERTRRQSLRICSRLKLRPGAVHRGRQELQPEPMTFQHINQRVIKSLAVGQHGGHELGRDNTASATPPDTPRRRRRCCAPCRTRSR